MILTGCLLDEDTLGPPGDPASLVNPIGWCHFFTGSADAWVWPETRRFILHWIESNRRGDGAVLMRAIGAWASMRRMQTGSLTCEPDLVGFYEKFGWRRGPEFKGFATMEWRRRQ